MAPDSDGEPDSDGDADGVWDTVRGEWEDLPSAAALETASGRPFAVRRFDDERLVVRFRDTGEARTLYRDELEALADRVAGDPDGVPFADVPPGAEPYVSVLSLHPRFVVDRDGGRRDGRLRRIEEGEAQRGTAGTMLAAEGRRADPGAVHDDALLLCDVLERRDFDPLADEPTDALVNLYVLLSDVQHGTTDLRRDAGDVLLERIGDEPVHSQYGSVRRTTREVRTLKDDETVVDVFAAEGIPRERLLGVDPDRVDVALAVTGVPESAVYDVDEQVFVRKSAVESDVKEARLEGLRDRLSGLGGEEAARLREEVEALERRIDDLLARREA